MIKVNYFRILGISVVAAFFMVGLVGGGAISAQERVADEVLRLHVKANSDTYEDQQLKLQVRDRILEYLHGKADTALNREQSEEILRSELPNIEGIAKDEIIAQGYDYDVTAQIGNFYFPTKSYDDFSLPAGNYDALRVVIGEGAGQNWWCVLYPQICGSDKGETLENVLNKKDYEMVQKVNFKFRIAEWLK